MLRCAARWAISASPPTYCKVGDLRDDLPEPGLQPCFHAVEYSNPRKHWRCTRWPYG